MKKELLRSRKAKSFTEKRPDTNVVFCDALSDIDLELGEDVLVLLDENIVDNGNITWLCNQLTEKEGNIIHLQAGEKIKEYTYYLNLKKQLESFSFDTLIIIGGGTVINLGTYLAHDHEVANNNSPIIIPTNTMSYADVAIGSLGLLNQDGIKNKRKVTRDPAQVIVSKSLYESAPVEAKTDGMIEVMKYSLLLDSSMFESSTAAFLGKENESTYFDLASHAMDLKIDLQDAIIEGNKSLELLLTYGHLHAHILEEYFEYAISHSIAVYIGMLIDLKLAGPEDTYKFLLSAPEGNPLKDKLIDVFSKINIKELETLYLQQEKYINSQTGKYNLVKISELGCYKKLNQEVSVKGYSFEEIRQVYKSLKDKIVNHT